MGQGVDIDIDASDFTLLYCLSHDQFLSVLKEGEFQDDFEKYCMLKDEILFLEKKVFNIFIIQYSQEILFQRCQSCNGKGHMVTQCPLITYVANRRVIFDRAKYGQKDERKAFGRKNTKYRALINAKYLENAGIRLRQKRTFRHMSENTEHNFSLITHGINTNILKLQDKIDDHQFDKASMFK